MNPITVMQTWQRFKALSNPQQFINRALQNNPQASELLRTCNNNPRQAFYELAKQKGIEPDSILNMLK